MSDTAGGELVRGLLTITRPVNAIVAGLLTFIGAFVGGGTPGSPEVIAAVVATVLAVAGGNTINDYFDRDIDRINAPDRPIPSGAVTPRQALRFSALLFTLAFALALTLPLAAIVIAAVNLVALVTYTPAFKGQPAAGNAVVAYLGGSTFLFGGLAVSAPGPTLVLALLAALSTFSREVVKDVEDVAGDEAGGMNTLPIQVGVRRSLVIGTASLALAVIASPLPYLAGTFGAPYLAVVAVADATFAYAAYASFEDPTAGQTYLKYGMFVAATAFVVGRITVL